MATPNITFGTPNGFEEIASRLSELGYEVDWDIETESEDCDESILGWRCWDLTLPNSERIYILECGGDEPMIMINLDSIKDGRRFRDDLLASGGIEHWDGKYLNKGFLWKRFYRNYERRLGSPCGTPQNAMD